MKQIERQITASGVIGEYDHKWTVTRLYDRKHDSAAYNLYIAGEYIDAFPSTVAALAALVEQFTE